MDSLQELDDGKVLLRLAHLYEVYKLACPFIITSCIIFIHIRHLANPCIFSKKYAKVGEDKELAKMANVELKKLFPNKKVN